VDIDQYHLKSFLDHFDKPGRAYFLCLLTGQFLQLLPGGDDLGDRLHWRRKD
jgi:hypothetical protein